MKLRLATHFLSLAITLIGLGFVTSVFSRTPVGDTPVQPLKLADMSGTYFSSEMASGYLDDMSSRLQKDLSAKGLMIAYGPEGEESGTGKFLLGECRTYLTNRADPKQIITVYGGPAKPATAVGLELWIVPAGAKMPKPVVNERETFSGLVGQLGGYEGTGSIDDYDSSLGPLPGNTVIAGFADILRHQPNSVGYIVTYQSSEDAPGAWRRAADFAVATINEYGITSDRLKVVYGGKDEGTTDHFWVLPKGEPLPIKEAVPDRLADKAVMIHQYDDDSFADSKAQEFAFKGIADLLKEYPDARICYMIISRVEHQSADDGNKAPKENPEHVETPKADFHQIVEQWRAKLISDFKVSPDRIVILYPTGVDEQFQGKMQSWIVPKNAVLPSPPKVDDDDPPEDDDPPVYLR